MKYLIPIILAIVVATTCAICDTLKPFLVQPDHNKPGQIKSDDATK